VGSSLSHRIASPIATCLGLGRVPLAPGTAGSLGALALGAVLVQYRGWGSSQFALLAAASMAPSVWAAHVVSATSGEKDPSRIVVDEAVGQWMTLVGCTAYNWKSWLAAFLLFRAFDIWKPPPVRHAENLPGGLGIVADDVVAGLYSALVLFAAGCFNFY